MALQLCHIQYIVVMLHLIPTERAHKVKSQTEIIREKDKNLCFITYYSQT